MKRWLIIIGLLFIIVPLAFYFRSIFLKKPAGLQITSEPITTVFLDNQNLGQTPFEDNNREAGDYLIKLIPQGEGFSSWEQKISLYPGFLTVINRQLAEAEELTSGSILTFESLKNKKLMVLAIISEPSGVLVRVDGITRSFTPLSLEDISEGEHLISLTLPGYQEKVIQIKTVFGQKLIVNAKLAKEKEKPQEATPSAQEEEEEEEEQESGKELSKPYIIINDTPTGWLRVRLEPSTTASEAARIDPGNKYKLLETSETGWYKIEYEEGKEGWVSGQYASKEE